MSVTLIIFAVIFGIIGIIGSIVPGLPGPPLSWAGLLLAYFGRRIGDSDNQITLTCLLVWLGITIAVTILDYIIPVKFTRMVGGSKASRPGCADRNGRRNSIQRNRYDCRQYSGRSDRRTCS